MTVKKTPKPREPKLTIIDVKLNDRTIAITLPGVLDMIAGRVSQLMPDGTYKPLSKPELKRSKRTGLRLYVELLSSASPKYRAKIFNADILREVAAVMRESY